MTQTSQMKMNTKTMKFRIRGGYEDIQLENVGEDNISYILFPLVKGNIYSVNAFSSAMGTPALSSASS